MKLKKQPIVTRKKSQPKKKEAKEVIQSRKVESKPFYTVSKESKKYYNVEVLTNNGNCQVGVIILGEDRYLTTIKGKLERKDEMIKKAVKGLLKTYYKVLPTREISTEIELPKKKQAPTPTPKPLPTPFIEWYKSRLQNLIEILDELGLGYITKNLEYRLNDYSKHFTVEIKVQSGGIVRAGSHRFLFKYNEKQYLYFFDGKLDAKGDSIRDLFKENEG